MKVLFLWSDISGYMAACWRALAAEPALQLKVIAYGANAATDFRHAVMDQIDWVPLPESSRNDVDYLARQIADFDADTVILCGWLNKAYRRLPGQLASSRRRFVMTMDTPWQGTSRQFLAPFLLHSYCRRIDTVVVTGERSWQYARRLGFAESQIIRGLYGVDHAALSRIFDARVQAGPWPRQFLFAGRYASEKGLALLLEAYAAYRSDTTDPWPLVCCGKGPLASAIARTSGVTDLGFLQPHEVHRVMAESGAFVLPSTFDPWPLALVEACAAGLPVIASEACGSAVELIRDGYCGFTFATADRDQLVRKLKAVHEHQALPDIGRRAREFAAAYSAEEWARRWRDLLLRN